jgi:hypothetical protein
LRRISLGIYGHSILLEHIEVVQVGDLAAAGGLDLPQEIKAWVVRPGHQSREMWRRYADPLRESSQLSF